MAFCEEFEQYLRKQGWLQDPNNRYVWSRSVINRRVARALVTQFALRKKININSDYLATKAIIKNQNEYWLSGIYQHYYGGKVALRGYKLVLVLELDIDFPPNS